MATEITPQPKPVAETKRTSLENFLDGFPMELAKQSLSTNLAELFRGAISQPM